MKPPNTRQLWDQLSAIRRFPKKFPLILSTSNYFVWEELLLFSDAYSKLLQTSKMELFAKIVKGVKNRLTEFWIRLRFWLISASYLKLLRYSRAWSRWSWCFFIFMPAGTFLCISSTFLYPTSCKQNRIKIWKRYLVVSDNLNLLGFWKFLKVNHYCYFYIFHTDSKTFSTFSIFDW